METGESASTADTSRVALFVLVFVPLILSPFFFRMYSLETGQSVDFEIFLMILLLVEFVILIGIDRSIIPISSFFRGGDPVFERTVLEIKCRGCLKIFFIDKHMYSEETKCPHCVESSD